MGKQRFITTEIHSPLLEMLQWLLDVTITLRLALTRNEKMLPLPKGLQSHRSYLHEVKAGVCTAAHEAGHHSECEGCVRWSTVCSKVLGLPA